ncbi:MAG: hypothetical protein ACXV4B_07850 [Halobacteriota archaeon]
MDDAMMIDVSTVWYRQEDRSIEITLELDNGGTYIEGYVDPYTDSSSERSLLEACLAPPS